MQSHKQKTEQIGVVQRFLGFARDSCGYKMEAPGTLEPNQKNSFKFRRLLSFEGLAKPKKTVARQDLTLCHFTHPRVCKLVFVFLPWICGFIRKLGEHLKTCRFHQRKRVGLGHGLHKVLLD